MKTRGIFPSLLNFLGRRVLPSATIMAFALPLAACNAPRIESPVESAGPCRTTYISAATVTTNATEGNPFIARYLAAGDAAQSWRQAATLCPSQFSVYTMKSAQMQWLQQSLSPIVGASPTHAKAALANLNDIVALNVSNDALASMALAEDRAGFEIEVLAARGVGGATLQLSDDHKAIASRLISLEAKDSSAAAAPNDPRQKVYDVGNLLAHPDTITDPSTGLQAPTVAVAEMNCARESLTALANTFPTSNTAKNNGSRDKTPRSTGSSKSLAVLSDLISSRIYLALSLGYPAFDHALYE
ncbi:hypothetical protein OZX73_06935 [Bifidobacterium sp. ESL0775]|uniref:hypothetical protein n=1 Tax=Bifidobacterium sp. ESL0775 TaxID=2983230 RepID=UPI0023FA0308|nr:hypothetical protein [Bifidobacterium sp. ESL0775]WEV68997.1 hypothetical protein OZX73_06935 [Bifidobacterium sp. ESL0775]